MIGKIDKLIRQICKFVDDNNLEIPIFCMISTIFLSTCIFNIVKYNTLNTLNTPDYQMERIKQDIEYQHAQIEYIKAKTEKLKQELKELNNTTIVDDTTMEYTNTWIN